MKYEDVSYAERPKLFRIISPSTLQPYTFKDYISLFSSLVSAVIKNIISKKTTK